MSNIGYPRHRYRDDVVIEDSVLTLTLTLTLTRIPRVILVESTKKCQIYRHKPTKPPFKNNKINNKAVKNKILIIFKE